MTKAEKIYMICLIFALAFFCWLFATFNHSAQGLELSPEEEIVALINDARSSSLICDTKLCELAQLRAEEGANRKHTRPDGRKWNTVFTDAGITATFRGEVICDKYESPETIVKTLLDSPANYRVLTNKRFTTIGVGFAEIDGEMKTVILLYE